MVRGRAAAPRGLTPATGVSFARMGNEKGKCLPSPQGVHYGKDGSAGVVPGPRRPAKFSWRRFATAQRWEKVVGSNPTWISRVQWRSPVARLQSRRSPVQLRGWADHPNGSCLRPK